MIDELYDRIETDSSKRTLEILANNLPEPVVILGGWAVYLTVNEIFEEELGHGYLGSKDVDLGFHIDPKMSLEELGNSNYAKTLTILQDLGYTPAGTSRFCKIIHRETGKTFTEEQAKNIPIFDLFYLYVDLILDQIHPKHQELFSIKPIDEPIIARAFENDIFNIVDIEGASILLPKPHILLATKLRAFPNRDKEDKKIKDACDIYALLWHSPIDYKQLIDLFLSQYPAACCGWDSKVYTV
ncbi:MAG: nucleotidyl transferase AbiEii/AbiGii toxin family protein [Calditrichia bacterium]